MATVLIIQENTKFAYQPAMQFGNICFALKPSDVPATFMNESPHFQEMFRKLEAVCADFDPVTDFLILTGNPIVLGYAFHLIYKRTGYVRCLQWDNYEKAYTTIIMSEN